MTSRTVPTLPPDATTRYLEAGYYVGEQLVEHEYIDSYLQDLSTISRAVLAHHRLPMNEADDLDAFYANLTTIHRHDQTLYLRMLLVFSRAKSLYDLFMSGGILRACGELGVTLPFMHTLPLFHIISNKLRIDGGYVGFEPHQDWTGLQTSLNAIIAWVPFHDIDATRFPLEVLPQSHLQGVCPGRIHNQLYQIDESIYRDTPFVPLEVRKGDVVFMSPFMIHRTGLTGTEMLRIAASWSCEDALEHTLIDRRYPMAQTRSVRHELFFPAFPGADEVRALLGEMRGR